MDWKDCLDEREVKQIAPDLEMARSLEKTSANKMISSDELRLKPETVASKISLSYDSVRELLEALSLKKGFKIYNHVCYTVFLKQIMKLPDVGDEFDDLRRIRNDINYYGKEVSVEDAKMILERLHKLRKELLRI